MQVQPTQSPVPLQPYQQLINEIMKLHVTQKEQLEKMKVIQKQVMMHPQKDTFTMLDNEQVCAWFLFFIFYFYLFILIFVNFFCFFWFFILCLFFCFLCLVF